MPLALLIIAAAGPAQAAIAPQPEPVRVAVPAATIPAQPMPQRLAAASALSIPVPAPPVSLPSPTLGGAPPTADTVRVAGSALVPQAVKLRSTTTAETEANAVWNLRAALNIAALQCQFSPFLATVRTYNAVLKHHADEFVRAQTVMTGHFKRLDGKAGLNNFDMYTTRTYNSYSTLDAQYSFCEAAFVVGRETLMLPKKALGAFALKHNADIRAALAPPPPKPGETFELASLDLAQP